MAARPGRLRKRQAPTRRACERSGNDAAGRPLRKRCGDGRGGAGGDCGCRWVRWWRHRDGHEKTRRGGFGGCGGAVLAAAFPELGIGFVGVSLAFGLTVLTAAYALGHISGGQFNPAVSIGLWAGGRFEAKELAPYIISQIIGATLAALVLYLIVQGQAGFAGTGGFATNGYGDLSPGKYALSSVLLIEVVLTAGFLMVIMGATAKRAPAGFAPIAIGLALTLIHLISIPVTNTSVNPARSTGVAFFAETAALSQLWAFWVAPIVGAVIGAVLYRAMAKAED